jgi:hypothetical protein
LKLINRGRPRTPSGCAIERRGNLDRPPPSLWRGRFGDLALRPEGNGLRPGRSWTSLRAGGRPARRWASAPDFTRNLMGPDRFAKASWSPSHPAGSTPGTRAVSPMSNGASPQPDEL